MSRRSREFDPNDPFGTGEGKERIDFLSDGDGGRGSGTGGGGGTGGVRDTPPDLGGGGTGGGPPKDKEIDYPPKDGPPPPKYEPKGSIIVYLNAPETVLFKQDDVDAGYGESIKIEYKPSTKFGNRRKYTVVREGNSPKNYFVVEIKKAFPDLTDTEIGGIKETILGPVPRGGDKNLVNTFSRRRNTTFDISPLDPDIPNDNPKDLLDIKYKEVISIQEFSRNSQSGQYEPKPPTIQRITDSVIRLNFQFEKPEPIDIDDPVDADCPEPNLAPPPPGFRWTKKYIDGQKCPIYELEYDGEIDPPPPVISDYNIEFTSNYTNELGEFIRCNYQIVDVRNDILDSDFVKLSHGNLDNKKTDVANTSLGYVNINIVENYETVRIKLNEQNLPELFSYECVYYANTKIAKENPNDFTKWNKVNKSFKISGKELIAGITVHVVFVKTEYEILYAPKIIDVSNSDSTYEVKESDNDKIITLGFITSNADFVDVYVSNVSKRVSIRNEKLQSTTNIQLSFQNDFQGIYGRKIVYLVPVNEFGIGETKSILVTFNQINDFPSLIELTAPEQIDVPTFSDLNVDFSVDYETFAATSVDVYIIDTTTGQIIPLFSNLPSNGTFNVNLRDLITKYLQGKKIDLVFGFIPYNRGGEKELVGNNYEVTISVIYPDIIFDEAQIKNALFQIISENIKINDLGPDSKYLTHLVNFGNNEQIIISSWEEDDWTLSEKVEDEIGNLVVKNKVDSLLLKLYSPLPSNISINSTLWITKLISNPLIETVILNEQDEIKCPPIKGPNFNLEYNFASGQATNFESLDNLILSSSVSASSTLVANYLSASGINTDDLNIQYYSGSNYLTGSLQWQNFVHYSSAKERVDNFVYKVQLIEAYDKLIASASTNVYGVGFNASITSSLGYNQEIERQRIKKEKIIQTFDGFEKFLYTPAYQSSSLFTTSDSDSITWPHTGDSKLNSDSNIVLDWYSNILSQAENFDIENAHSIENNIPQYILQNVENSNLLLFFSMIGHHFDNIFFYTKSIEKSRNRGYKKTDISDKLLYDTLKSLGWDANNIAANKKLWEYSLGYNVDGDVKNSKTPKDRNNEIWRRILNNLTFLLKNKGTKRGIHALMACYGIPSSNLTILEFGGPEPAKRFNDIEDVGTTKLSMDNLTYTLNMNSGSIIELEWKTTDKGDKPKTIELFTKPAYAGNWTILSGSGNWNLQLSGSSDSEFGKVIFNSGSTTIVSSSLLPIFNDRFFGICLSTGSYGIKLDLKQIENDRNIFENAFSSSTSNNFSSGSKLWIGGNYSGSIDELRLWSTPLSSSAFYKHVFFPEAINGNHISSSTEDLFFRLDFEYPKNLALTSSLINVDTNIYFSQSVVRNDLENGTVSIISFSTIFSENVSASFSASAYYFSSSLSHPYNFEPLERTISLEIPNVGSSRYSTNKIRFESQTDIFGNDVSGGINLSVKSRATKKSFDNSPIDTNRVGLFFSPTKELNIDIAKSFGGISLDDYIGNPADEYKENYKSLDILRNYYFQRFDGRDIYQYINLIKSYEESLFKDIKKMLPARVKATAGLLIEPHILERSKIKQSKPTGSNYQQESLINTKQHILTTAETNQYVTTINTDESQILSGQNNQYEGNVFTASVDSVLAENYQFTSSIDADNSITTESDMYQQQVTINAELSKGTLLSEIDIYDLNSIVGQTDFETVGFGIYAEHGHAIRTFFNKEGRRVKQRIKVDLITEQKSREVLKPNFVIPSTGKADPRGGYYLTSSFYTETRLNIQPFSGSKVINAGTGSIVSVVPVNGYLGTHYRNTSDLTRGMENSFFRGSKNTSATTLDGTPPVETFTTNPNTLRVNKAGRDASEPILEVE